MAYLETLRIRLGNRSGSRYLYLETCGRHVPPVSGPGMGARGRVQVLGLVQDRRSPVRRRLAGHRRAWLVAPSGYRQAGQGCAVTDNLRFADIALHRIDRRPAQLSAGIDARRNRGILRRPSRHGGVAHHRVSAVVANHPAMDGVGGRAAAALVADRCLRRNYRDLVDRRMDRLGESGPRQVSGAARTGLLCWPRTPPERAL